MGVVSAENGLEAVEIFTAAEGDHFAICFFDFHMVRFHFLISQSGV